MEMIDLAPQTGIYKIVNKHTGRVYVGQAEYFIVRWAQHVQDLVKNKHHNSELQADFRIYGLQGFEFEIVELCNKRELTKRESYHTQRTISPYNMAGKNAVNKWK